MANDNTIYVEKSDRPFSMNYGAGFWTEKLPVGTRVLYPNPPMEGLRYIRDAVHEAVENPHGCDPLSAQLTPGMKVTICIDDISLPLPPMRTPDFRQQMLEYLLEKLGDAGVDDFHIVVAIGLHRRMTPAEIKRSVGPKVFKACYPDKLYNHDSEDYDNLVHLGHTEHDEDVELNKRAVESDLVIYCNINLVKMDGGHKSLQTGISSYRSVKHHHNSHTLLHCDSLMDPPKSALYDSVARMGRIVNEHMNVFHIETSLNSDTFPHAFPFLQKPERSWNAFDRAQHAINKTTLSALTLSVGRKIFMRMPAPYLVTGVNAGKTEPVHERTLAKIQEQQWVKVDGQADVVIAGVPYISPYNVNSSVMNPLLVNCLTAGYMFHMYEGVPLVRQGGVMILPCPLEYKFDKRHHPSYVDLFEEALPDCLDPADMEAKYEEKYASDPGYLDAYRNDFAYHGVHPLYMWYWAALGMKHMGQIIYVGAKSDEAAKRMGFEVAPNVAEAVEMAKNIVGKPNPDITCFHMPPIFVCDMTGTTGESVPTHG
jgi:hypothetical protein